MKRFLVSLIAFLGLVASANAQCASGYTQLSNVFACQQNTTGAPVITSPTTASGTVGVGFSYQITATNSPTSFGASNLPPALGVNSSTGVISGQANAAGTTTVGLSATNGTGTGTQNLALTIGGAVSAQAIDVNFSGTSFPLTGLGAYTGDGVSSPSWNNIVASSGSGSSSSLLKSDGTAATGITIAVTSSSSFAATTTPPIFTKYLTTLAATKSITFTGLVANGNYTLYLYGENGGYNSRGATFAITTGTGGPASGSNASTLNAPIGSSAYAENANYVVFNVTADGTGSIVMSWTANASTGTEGNLNGLQLVH